LEQVQGSCKDLEVSSQNAIVKEERGQVELSTVVTKLPEFSNQWLDG